MKDRKRNLTESLLLGSALALAIIFIARQQMLSVLEWISPVFYLPGRGSALLSGNWHEPPPWLFHALLVLQCVLLVFFLGWLLGRYRGQPAKAYQFIQPDAASRPGLIQALGSKRFANEVSRHL